MRKIIAKRQDMLRQLIKTGSMDALNIANVMLKETQSATVAITELLDMRQRIATNPEDKALQRLFIQKKEALLSEL
jgi:hypothetical protein